MSELTQYVRKADIAKSLQVGCTTIDRWIAEGKLALPEPYRPTLRSSLYNLDEVNEAIDAMMK